MADKQAVNEAIEPHTMQVPKMDRPSVALAWFLETMTVEEGALFCGLCQREVCTVEDGDTLRVLLNTALAHGCKD